MGLLRITRDSGYADRLRAYQVYVDGAKAGDIRDGETKEFSLPDGEHTLKLKIDWCGSKVLSFTLGDSDVATFYAKSNLRGPALFATLWYVLFDRNAYLVLESGAR